MRRRLQAIAAAVAVVAMMMLGPPAHAEAPSAVGWWWAGRPTETTPVIISPVPPVPESGLYVAGGANQSIGISALRFESQPEATSATVTLTIAHTTGIPAITACLAAEDWEPTENGAWDQRPEPDCESTSITGTLSADESKVSFEGLPLQEQDVVDVVLVPGLDPDSGQPANFSTSFEEVDADTIVFTRPSGGPPSAAATQPSQIVTTTHADPPAPDELVPHGSTTPLPPLEPVDQHNAGHTADEIANPAAPVPLAAGSVEAARFAYPAVLALPLVLLLVGSYLGWALTQPVAVSTGARQVLP